MTALGEFIRPHGGLAWPGARWLADRIWRVEHAFERAKAEGRPADDVRIRMVFILAVFIAGFVALGYGATKTAIFPQGGRSGHISSMPPGSRADLVDRNGQLLAIDLPNYSLYLDRSLIWDQEETRQRLGAFLNATGRRRLEMALRSDKRTKIVGPLSAEQKAVIDDLGLPGVSFETVARREYPLGATAAHLLGYSGADENSLSGAERALNDEIVRNAGGDPVMLALDLRVQAALEDELRRSMTDTEASGAVGIVTNVRTGEILALASLPDAAPDKLAGSPAETNRAWQSVYEMGSTFKIFSMALGLDSGTVNMNTRFDVSTPLMLPGKPINDFHGTNGSLSLAEVFTHSSNIGTGKLALHVGRETLTKYFREFGLFEAAPTSLSGSARPLLPDKPERWNDREVATTSFGHAIAVSPLTMATAVGSVVNGGTYIPLSLTKRDIPPKGRRVISEATSRQMLELMRLNAVTGTGRRTEAAAPGYRVGGKTGTADKVREGGGYGGAGVVASFAAAFPTDGPLTGDRFLVFILVDHPKATAASPGQPGGASVAAPVAGRVINRIAPFVGVTRVATAPVPLSAVPIQNQTEALEH
jgi:cell division protein FtsI (penicillin-binding protein 3)